ncbi:hypothetical protein Sjap_019628 [Stephania japonica]|uniref:Tac7077 n=1 Tax=Stephania japonica TaxID=461633 RepID=A0AAP0HZW8_9MAGN
MINRQFLRFIYPQIPSIDSHTCFPNWASLLMALLNKDPFFPGLHGRFRCRRNQSPNANVGLNLRSCYDGCDGFPLQLHRPHSLGPPNSHVVNNKLDAHVEDKTRLVNGHSVFKHGSPLGFPDRAMRDKLLVAVDVDEVLGNFVSALNKFIADRYSTKHSVSEYHVYEFFKIWNCSRDEADIRVHEFFKTAYFKTGIHPIPGAHAALHKLSAFCNLSVVLVESSRQNAIKDHTIEWIEKHYPGLFQGVHFGNHFALDGKSRPKSDICRSLGAQVLIDDNPRYAIECADIGMRVLLFDYENSYPWCKSSTATQHPLITKVHDWQEVEQQLVSWITS